MPRQSRGSAPRRPSAPPARAPAPQQTRSASTAAAPMRQAAPPSPAQTQGGMGSGLFGQMASTAAGVAVGSSIGHAVGGWFGGSSAPTEAAPTQPESYGSSDMYASNNGQFMQYSQDAYASPASANETQNVCLNETQGFKRCMTENKGDLTICGWYLDQLKSCRAAAAPY